MLLFSLNSVPIPLPFVSMLHISRLVGMGVFGFQKVWKKLKNEWPLVELEGCSYVVHGRVDNLLRINVELSEDN